MDVGENRGYKDQCQQKILQKFVPFGYFRIYGILGSLNGAIIQVLIILALYL